MDLCLAVSRHMLILKKQQQLRFNSEHILKPTFFSVVSHRILSHTASVSELPGSIILFDVILPKNLSSDWRGISFNKALQTYTNNQPYVIFRSYGVVLHLLHLLQSVQHVPPEFIFLSMYEECSQFQMINTHMLLFCSL